MVYVPFSWMIIPTENQGDWPMRNLREGMARVEKAMAPHSSTLAWKIPWTEESGGLQSMGSLRVGHNWATSLSLFTVMHGRRKWQPTPVFLHGESHGEGNLVGCHLWGRRDGHDWSDLPYLMARVPESWGWNLSRLLLPLWRILKVEICLGAAVMVSREGQC